MAAHRYWRLLFSETWSTSNFLCVAELQLRATAGGADQTSSSGAVGTATASSQLSSSWVPAQAVDDNTGTAWLSSGSAVVGEWLQWTAVTAIEVAEIAITSRFTASVHPPKSWKVQWSDDGTAWTDAADHTTATDWGLSETRTFTVGTPVASPISVRKAQGYAVLDAAGTRIGLRKAEAYAVLDAAGNKIGVRKAVGYAVLDSAVTASTRRPPTIAICG